MINWNWRDWLVVIMVAFGVLAALGKCAGAAPCFASLSEARASVGPARHIAWTGRGSSRVYFAGYRGQHPRCDQTIRTASNPVDRLLAMVTHEPEVRQAKSRVHQERPQAAPMKVAPVTTGSASLVPDPVAEGRRLADEIWSWKDMNSSPELLAEGKRLLAIAMKKEARR